MTYGGDRSSDYCPGCGVVGVRPSHNGHDHIQKCDNPRCSVHQFWSVDGEGED